MFPFEFSNLNLIWTNELFYTNYEVLIVYGIDTKKICTGTVNEDEQSKSIEIVKLMQSGQKATSTFGLKQKRAFSSSCMSYRVPVIAVKKTDKFFGSSLQDAYT